MKTHQRKKRVFDRKLYKKSALKQIKGQRFVLCLTWLLSACVLYIIYTSYKRISSCFGNGFVFALAFALGLAGIFVFAQFVLYLAIFYKKEDISFDTFFKGFEMWLPGIFAMLWYSLFVALWGILLIIPGIVKSFAYSQMFWIIAENPGISVKKAMAVSKIMTKGHKADLFSMLLSFSGWGILAIIPCGLGLIFLVPYIMASYCNAYFDLKRMAILEGRLTPADFAA